MYSKCVPHHSEEQLKTIGSQFKELKKADPGEGNPREKSKVLNEFFSVPESF